MIVEGEVPMMEKICRSCMGENEHMQNLYGPGEGEDGQSLQLADMLMACTAVQVNKFSRKFNYQRVLICENIRVDIWNELWLL